MTPTTIPQHTLGDLIHLVYTALRMRHGARAADYATALLVDAMLRESEEQ